MKPYLLIITGPTAVGKTDLALQLAARIPTEIINIDVGQFYEPLTIGTAKPDWRSSPIPHHLFDILSEPKDYTVVAYREQLQELVKDIWQRNKLPICVGGSLFYVQSLFFPPRSETLAHSALAEAPTWHELYTVDPQRAQQIHPNDTYRIKRAFMLWHATQTKPSTFMPAYEPLADAHVVFLTRAREQLYQRINERVKIMLEDGWVDEVTRLQNTAWEPFLERKKLIGYNEIMRHLVSPTTYTREQLVEDIQRKTRHYAKRQCTFWKTLSTRIGQVADPRHTITIETVDLTMYDYDLYINHLLGKLHKYL